MYIVIPKPMTKKKVLIIIKINEEIMVHIKYLIFFKKKQIKDEHKRYETENK